MAKFVDAMGRDWAVRLTVADLRPLREAGLDLSAAFQDPGRFADLLALDPATLGQVLWVLCGRQAEPKGVTPEQFAAGFDGPTLFAAIDAVMEAVVDFRHRPAAAPAVKKAMAAAMTRLDRATIRAAEATEAEEETGSTSNAPAGSSAGSPASTPAP